MGVLWFDGLLAQVQDAGVYFLPEDDAAELREAAAINRFRCVRADLQDCADAAMLVAGLAQALHLAPLVDRDWDALGDALAGLRAHDTKGLVLLLEHSALLRRSARGDFKQAMTALQAASQAWAERGLPFWIFVALPEAEFDALE